MDPSTGARPKTEAAHSRQGVILTEPSWRVYCVKYASKGDDFRLLCCAPTPLGAKFCPRCGFPILDHAWVVWLA